MFNLNADVIIMLSIWRPIEKHRFFRWEFGAAVITVLPRTSGLTGPGWVFQTSPGWRTRSAAAGSRPDRLRFGSALRSGSVRGWQLTFLQRERDVLTHRDSGGATGNHSMFQSDTRWFKELRRQEEVHRFESGSRLLLSGTWRTTDRQTGRQTAAVSTDIHQTELTVRLCWTTRSKTWHLWPQMSVILNEMMFPESHNATRIKRTSLSFTTI